MIWVTGCKGLLGTEVCKLLENKKLPWIGTDIEVDITSYEALEKFTNSVETASYFPSKLSRTERQINWIINCAAYTYVDAAEQETETADSVNHLGAQNIARIARKIGAKLIHISTDYVFDGKQTEPYTETFPKTPLGVYGKTKSDGEDAIQKEMNTYYIIRTSWLYGKNGTNFVNKIINEFNTKDSINVVNDQIGTPTYAADLANVILQFMDKSVHATGFFGKNSIPSYGIYNFTNGGQISWYDFACEIYKYGKKAGVIKNDCSINQISTQEYGSTAVRPAYSVLNKEKICKELKIKPTDWKVSLEKYFKN